MTTNVFDQVNREEHGRANLITESQLLNCCISIKTVLMTLMMMMVVVGGGEAV